MQLLLHQPDAACNLSDRYKQAFAHAVELLVVSAYLTEWDSSLILNKNCKHFRMIVGKDFGITRRAACEAVISWLSPERRADFMVAGQIGGFHPKALFWKEATGHAFAIVGSSNLTIAAFEKNYEANVYCPLSPPDYQAARRWISLISSRSLPVSKEWLQTYKEAPLLGNNGSAKSTGSGRSEEDNEIHLSLPRPRGMREQIEGRRGMLDVYKSKRAGLMRLFRSCADRKITSAEFYNRLPSYWGGDVGDRLQGKGFERTGKSSNFQTLSESLLAIVGASEDDRDDVVIAEVDRLAAQQVPTRRAFLSEMLCLEFPDLFPVVNRPVETYLRDVAFRYPAGASEGARYIDLARKLRLALFHNPTHPAKNLAELDTVIWLKYHDRA